MCGCVGVGVSWVCVVCDTWCGCGMCGVVCAVVCVVCVYVCVCVRVRVRACMCACLCKVYTVDREIFTKIICVKNFHVVKFF